MDRKKYREITVNFDMNGLGSMKYLKLQKSFTISLWARASKAPWEKRQLSNKGLYSDSDGQLFRSSKMTEKIKQDRNFNKNGWSELFEEYVYSICDGLLACVRKIYINCKLTVKWGTSMEPCTTFKYRVGTTDRLYCSNFYRSCRKNKQQKKFLPTFLFTATDQSSIIIFI